MSIDSKLRILETRAPRYTSYPTADRFQEGFKVANLRPILRAKNYTAENPLSLYFHLIFCSELCYYCACNKVVSNSYERAVHYLDTVIGEMDFVKAMLKDSLPVVDQLHFGGGTPSYYKGAEIVKLMGAIRKRFQLLENGEYSIEIDPRHVCAGYFKVLSDEGLNRVSFGVQDFNLSVQRAINRIQPVELVWDKLEQARDAGFESINFDLVYGLPFQNTHTVAQTLNTVIEMRPNRIALFNYAHLPARFRAQRLIPESSLPKLEERLEMFDTAVEALVGAGYSYIGMDHFALSTDGLAIAAQDGELHRNFQGYSTHAERDLLGFGASAISNLGSVYYQNERNLRLYSNAIDHNSLPITRGMILTDDDLLRREVIDALMSQGVVEIAPLVRKYAINFDDYFAVEREELNRFEALNLLSVTKERIQLSDIGQKMASRVIASVFDVHLRNKNQQNTYSTAI